jgi:hypothetical protein
MHSREQNANSNRNLVHSADPEEIDHLESYLNQQIPDLGDVKQEDSSL